MNFNSSKPKKDALIFLGVFLLPLLIRLFYLNIFSHDPMFTKPVIDSLEFDIWGYRIAHGQLLWNHLQNHPPLYAYFLGIIYALFGYNPLYPVLIQYFIFSVSTLILYDLAQRLFDQKTALIGVFLMSAYWFLIYLPSFLYSENLSMLFNLLILHALIFRKESYTKYTLIGLLLGLSAVCRPQILFFSLLLMIWLIASKPKKHEKAFYPAVLLSGILIFTAPVLVRNYMISGEITYRTQAGANLYMGNNPDFHGTNLYVQIGKEWEQFMNLPYQKYKRPYTHSESDQYFTEETVRIIKEHPMQWAALIIKKAYALLLGIEFLRSEDVYIFQQYFALSPFAIIQTNVIFVLGLVGIILSIWRRKQRLFYIYLFLSASFLLMLFFPIKTRYLTTFIPFVIIFASYAIRKLAGFALSRDLRHVLPAFLITAVLFLASNVNPLGLAHPDASETLYAIAKNYSARSQKNQAILYFEATIKMNPNSLSAHNDLGVLYMGLKEWDKAFFHFDKALDIDGTSEKTLKNIELWRQLQAENKN